MSGSDSDDPLHSDEDIYSQYTDGSRDNDALSEYSWNGHYGDVGDIEDALADPLYGNGVDIEDTIAGPLYADGEVLQPNANWIESKRLQEEDGSHSKMWYARRKDYLMKYAAAKKMGMPLREKQLQELLQYSPEAMKKSVDRQMRHALKTENMDHARAYHTKDANLVDDMRRGISTLARQKLRNSPGKTYLDNDVIDKILRYVDPQMQMPGVPHDLNEYHHVVYPTPPAFPVAALGSRHQWLSRQVLHPMYREPYHPFEPPDWPIDEERLRELQRIEDQDCESTENLAMKSVYKNPMLVSLINSYM